MLRGVGSGVGVDPGCGEGVDSGVGVAVGSGVGDVWGDAAGVDSAIGDAVAVGDAVGEGWFDGRRRCLRGRFRRGRWLRRRRLWRRRRSGCRRRRGRRVAAVFSFQLFRCGRRAAGCRKHHVRNGARARPMRSSSPSSEPLTFLYSCSIVPRRTESGTPAL